MISVLYSISIALYTAGIFIFSLFNKKAKQWVSGRKGLVKGIHKAGLNNPLWFHCASLGEFEQGRPLIEAIKEQQPATPILLTFYSPSGYEIRKNNDLADYTCYLPVDLPKQTKSFVKAVNPKAVFFIKYEFWYNLLYTLEKAAIPTYLVSGIFREGQHFFQLKGWWFRKRLQVFTWFFVQDKNSERLLKSIGYNNVSISGDTRFDRVKKIAQHDIDFPYFKTFSEGHDVLIAGSTWPADEEKLAALADHNKTLRFIIAPHEVDESHIQQLQKLLPEASVRYSEQQNHNADQCRIVIIDSIGILNKLYRYATIAYIGGGFTKGIHNILEAATFGLPVIFGPNYDIFKEAHDLIAAGGAFSVDSNEALIEKTTQLLTNKAFYLTSAGHAQHYVDANCGATDIILSKTLNKAQQP